MEVRIRLQKSKSGTKHRYNYRIVAMPSADRRQGRALDILGYYDAARRPAVLEMDIEKIDKWIEKGAQLSDTVRALVKKQRKKKS